MSPASSGGALEVERYIGACLISSQSRAKRYEYFVPGDVVFRQQKYHLGPGNTAGSGSFRRCHSVDGWAGGMPLISFANHQRRIRKQQASAAPQNQQQDDRTPSVQEGLTRLAVHTQGAPLILTQKYNGRGRNGAKKPPSQKDSGCGDAVSVTSDESTGTTNTENTLPRIIKPRKRRKKDRKPPHLLQPFNHEDGLSTDSASPEVDFSVSSLEMVAPYFPLAYRQYDFGNRRAFLDTYVPNSENVKSDISESPNLHHRFEDVEDLKEDESKDTTTSCQCTYCNPADQIWDVSKSCYSPFLTTPTKEKAFHFDGNNENVYGSQLPKQLIDAISTISLNGGGDRKLKDKKVLGGSRNLEISTEIVTSLNGHRDLEIKLFPSFSTSEGVREVNNNGIVQKCSSDGCFKGIIYRSLSLQE